MTIMINPVIKVDCWLDGEVPDELIIALMKKPTGQLQTIERYIVMKAPSGEEFAVRINEITNALEMLDNAGDEMA